MKATTAVLSLQQHGNITASFGLPPMKVQLPSQRSRERGYGCSGIDSRRQAPQWRALVRSHSIS
jgi:hypothetical protein